MAGFVSTGLTVLLIAIGCAQAQLSGSGSGSGFDPTIHRPDADTFIDEEIEERIVSWTPDADWNLCERYPLGT